MEIEFDIYEDLIKFRKEEKSKGRYTFALNDNKTGMWGFVSLKSQNWWEGKRVGKYYPWGKLTPKVTHPSEPADLEQWLVNHRTIYRCNQQPELDLVLVSYDEALQGFSELLLIVPWFIDPKTGDQMEISEKLLSMASIYADEKVPMDPSLVDFD